jgi:hypothetical protein
MKYVIGSGKLYIWNNMQNKFSKLQKCAFYKFNYTYTYINKIVILTFSDKIDSQVIKWKTKYSEQFQNQIGNRRKRPNLHTEHTYTWPLTFTFLHSYNYNNHQDTAKPVYIEHP